MPIIRDATREEFDRLETLDALDREVALATAEREHAYRIAKLKYLTAGKYRMWGRVLTAFAKAPVWVVLAFHKGEMPEHWKKFLDI